jgi:predicted HTH transcriptional regulator
VGAGTPLDVQAPPSIGLPGQHAGIMQVGQGAERSPRVVRQVWVLEHLQQVGEISPRGYAAALGVSVDTALLDLRELVDSGQVRAEGSTKNRRYSLRVGAE